MKTTKRRAIKSDAENQFELDQEMIDDISNSEEFSDVEITNEDVMDALQAIDALADAVIEKADAEQKEIDADALLDEVRDMIDDAHTADDEALEEDEELPEELLGSSIQVMVSDDEEITIEKKPDEVYDTDVDGLECTMFDTCKECPLEVEEAGVPVDDEKLLVIGNSATKNYKKGYVKITSSSSNKKAWSSACKKVKKMIGNAKMTAVHWVIVSALAKKEEEEDKKKKKLECALLKHIRSNNETKSKITSKLKAIKSSGEFDENGQPIANTKPNSTVGEGNNGFEEIGSPTNVKSPEQVDSQSGNPTEDPDKQVKHGDDEAVMFPESEMIILEVPLTNSKRKVALKKIGSSKIKNCVMYKVLGAGKIASALDGKVLKNGDLGYVFKDTANGLLACSAKFVDAGKGTYNAILNSKGTVEITKGKESKEIFNSFERKLNAKAIASARQAVKSAKLYVIFKDGRQEEYDDTKDVRESLIENPSVEHVETSGGEILKNSTKKKFVANSAVQRKLVERQKRREAITNALKRKHEGIKSNREISSRRAEIIANAKTDNLRRMHEAEERKRLFQNSQSVMNEEAIAIKSGADRNAKALGVMYNSMF